ncbi:hypothetical protein C8R46DRAFT_1221842 [Mycena filopes]|nr:hypothetical protein C8R46DRAFT_1221842 [Mycena filopes]
MRGKHTVHYYAMRAVEDHELDDEMTDTETSVTMSSLNGEDGDSTTGGSGEDENTTTPGSSSRESNVPYAPIITDASMIGVGAIILGSYNRGPDCAVCHGCALVSRDVAVTPENGLAEGQSYLVCEHLACVGQEHDGPSSEEGTVVDEDAPYGTFEGHVLNALGDPDYPSAQEELREFEEMRGRAHLRPLTSLEYDANMRWLIRFREYPEDESVQDEERENERRLSALHDPETGSIARAEAVLDELQIAREDEARIARHGPREPMTIEPAQLIVIAQLGEQGPLHECRLRAADRHHKGVITRRLSQVAEGLLDRVRAERNDAQTPSNAIDLWDHAFYEATNMIARLSWELSELRGEYLSVTHLQAEAAAAIEAARAIDENRILPRVFAETATPDLDNRASEADDYDLHNTTGYSWAEEQRRSDERTEEGQPAFRPSNCEDAPGDPGHETQFYRAMRAEAESMAVDSNSNDLFRYPITPEESDEIILRSNVYWTTESLPKLRAREAPGNQDVSDACIRARASAAKYREAHREEIKAANTARRARLKSTNLKKSASRKDMAPKLKRTADIKESRSHTQAVTPPSQQAAIRCHWQRRILCLRLRQWAVAMAPAGRLKKATSTVPPVQAKRVRRLRANEGTPLFAWPGRRLKYDVNAVVTANQRRCRMLRRCGLEGDNGEDSNDDLPAGMCGCDNTLCMRIHKNESQKRKDWKRFHIEHPDC